MLFECCSNVVRSESENYKGDIYIGNANVKNISPKYWRSVSGNVCGKFYFHADPTKAQSGESGKVFSFARKERQENAIRIFNLIC